MKKGIKTVFVLGLLLVASIFTVAAYQGQGTAERTYERGAFHEDMLSIVEEGTYDDLVAFREANNGFGGPRWVTDEASFDQWKERHSETYTGEPGYMNKGQRGGYGRSGGCPMSGY